MKKHTFIQKRSIGFLVFILSICLGAASPSNIYGVDRNDMLDEENGGEIHMLRGDLEKISVESLERVSVSNPEIADVVNADTNEVLMLAKEPGQTSVFLWDANGKKTLVIRVFDEDLDLVESRLKELLNKAEIPDVYLNVNSYEGKVVVTGQVSEEKADELNGLLDRFGPSVLNLVEEEVIEDMVQVDVQIVELNRSYSQDIGFDWQDAITITETVPDFDGGFGDLWTLGDLGRTQFQSVINMFVKEGKGRVLSKPKLVVASGKEASFLVGGEVPVISTTTTSGGNVQEDIEYRDFGVSLAITPTIKEDLVDVILEIEVSDIDPTNSIGQNFAFTTRTAQTQLFLEDGQTIVLAGLIKKNSSIETEGIPFLSKIPVLGLFFRNTSTPDDDTETELVITLTPTVIAQAQKKAMAKKGSESSGTSMDVVVSEMPRQIQKVEMPQDMIPQSVSQYAQAIQHKIADIAIYPDEARENGWEGTVKLALHVLNDGTLAHAAVKESSGYSLFDEGALMAAKVLAPYSGFPAGTDLQEINITVPIVYSLKSQ